MGRHHPDQFFPEIGRAEVENTPALVTKIPLEQALRGLPVGDAASANPLIRASAGLLALLGRLRSQVVEMEAMPLLSHVGRDLEGFELRAQNAGADRESAQIAKYVLCGVADDIVQNLPGTSTNRDLWVQYAMEARFFNLRTSGVGIFEEITKALADPIRRYDLLELMLVCLQLGFRGRYKLEASGDIELQRIRRQVFETLRRVRPRDDDDISPHWQGQQIIAQRHRRRVPVWVMASAALLLLVGSFLFMRFSLAARAHDVATEMRGMHPAGAITLPLTTRLTGDPRPPTVYEPPTPPVSTQLERIQAALREDIDAQRLEVSNRGNFIAVTANNALMNFDFGQARVRSDISPIARRISAALDSEPGEIQVVGYTDNVGFSGTGRYRSNQQLSEARAEAVAALLRGYLSDQARIAVVGRGESDPIADNGTQEGRAMNRRVEILIAREDAL